MKAFTVVAEIVAAGLLIASAGGAAGQADYPNKPIRMISPYVPGGGTTIMGRLLGQKLTESWGQNVILDNRPGAGGMVGSETLAKAPPDGYSIILLSVSDHVLVPLLFKAPYDPIKDFAPVATVAIGERLLVINPSVPANNLQELIAFAKSNPGQLNYASIGNGSTPHLATELLGMKTGVKMVHVPYKGGGQAVTDLVGGHVQLYLGSVASLIPHVKSGRLKAIAISGETRLSILPQVPTFTQAGVAGFDVKIWYGLLAPARTPSTIIYKMSAEITRILAMPDVKDTLLSLGMLPFASTPDQIPPMMKADMVRFAKIIKVANIKMEQ